MSMTAAVGWNVGQRTGRVSSLSSRARARASQQHRSRRSHCAAFAATDERVSRLRDFFDTESMDGSLLGQNKEVEGEAGDTQRSDVTAGVVGPAGPGARRGARPVAVTEAGADQTARTEPQDGLKSGMVGPRPSKSDTAGFPGTIRLRLGRPRFANPREAALRALASYEVQLRERLDRFPRVSVSLPPSGSLPVPAAVRGLALDSRYRAPAAIGVAAVLIVLRLMAVAKNRRVAAVLEEKQMAIRERRGEKQRERFRQMFAGEDGVDASVFSAVRQKGENAVGEAAAAASRSMSGLPEELAEEDNLYPDASMDEEIEKAYKDFVKNSKLGEGEFWNIEDEVEEFAKIEIDFDAEDDE